MKIPTHVLNFAGGVQNIMPYEAFRDYWNHYRSLNGAKNVEFQSVRKDGSLITFDEKEKEMNRILVQEIVKRSGVNYAAEMPVEQWFNHPLVRYETFAIVSAMVDMVIPESIIDSIGLYTDVRVGGWGDSFAFNIKPRDLFVVSKSGRAKRSSEVHKQFDGQVTIVPDMHEITVAVSMYKILSGMESLAEFTAKAVRSIETQMTLDVYNSFSTAMASITNTATTGLRVAGYTQEYLVRLCQQVSSWNGGAKSVVVGTQLALMNVLPNDANYRYMLEDDYVKLGYVRTAFGYDVMALPQVANISTPFGMALSDGYIWVISPSAQKLVKLCLEGNTISNTTAPFEYANLSQETTLMKSWGVGIATNSVGGTIVL